MYINRGDFEKATLFEKGLEELAEYCKAAATTSGGTPTTKRRSDAATQHAKLIANISEYSDMALKAPMSQGSSEALAEMCQLVVPMAKLTKNSDVGNCESILKATEQFKKIRQQKGFVNIKAIADTIPQLMEQGQQSLEKCTGVLSQSTLVSDSWAAATKDIFALVSSIVDQPHLGDLLEEHMEHIKRMLFAAEELESQQQQAVVDGEMKLSELLYFKKIAMQESMVEVFKKCFDIIDGSQVDTFAAPLKEVHKVHNKTNDAISEMIKAQEELKKNAQEDIKKLKMASLSLKNDDNTVRKQFTDYVAANNAQLEENAKKQDKCFEAIMQLEKVIADLGTERTGLVRERIATIKKEQQRTAAIVGFEAFNRERAQRLVATLQTCELADEATDIMDEFICNTCNSVEQHLRAVEADIEKRKSNAHDMRLTHFRGLYLTLGELQYKKERNLEEIDKKIAHTHIQQDIAMDTLDPKAKEFAQLKKELISVREDMEAQLNVIQDKAQLQIEYFKPTEVALVEAGKDFKHPVAELQDRNQARQQKLLEYKKLMTPDDDEDEVDEDGTPTKRRGYNAEAELQRIEMARASMQPRKPKTPMAGGVGSSMTSSMNKAGWAQELQPLPGKISRNLPDSPVSTPSKADAASSRGGSKFGRAAASKDEGVD